jgi:hypothetical protein
VTWPLGNMYIVKTFNRTSTTYMVGCNSLLNRFRNYVASVSLITVQSFKNCLCIKWKLGAFRFQEKLLQIELKLLS